MTTAIFDRYESAARYYCRLLPTVLVSANGAIIRDEQQRRYVDLLSACGALNFGHNEPSLKKAAIDFLSNDGIVAALDFYTGVKREFISTFHERILQPRGLDYRLQFTGPTGTNSVEAALKLARKVTGRHNVVAFSNAFHGVSAGALSATASAASRRSLAGHLAGTTRLAYEGYCGSGIADIARFEAMALDRSGGIDPVAAILVETVQGEGGLNVASPRWLRALSQIAARIGALLIVDDIQAGVGRTGTFFSFERAGIVPDMVCLAKSISGMGFPMSLLLMKPDLDRWSPGEHNGTFRGNSLAFATATAALRLWDEPFQQGIAKRSDILSRWCRAQEAAYPGQLRGKGIGMMQGLQFRSAGQARDVAKRALLGGVLLECCGPEDEVMKIMAPLNIDETDFVLALDTISSCIAEIVDAENGRKAVRTITSEMDEAPLDPGDHCGHPVGGAELPHGVS